MSETRRYEGPIRKGMRVQMARRSAVPYIRTVSDYRPGSKYAVHYEDGDAGGDDSEEVFRGGRMPLVPATPEGWALFLPDGPLPDTGRKTFKVGQVWAATFDSIAVVFRVRDEKAVTVGAVPGDVLSHRNWWGSDRINLADVHQSTTALLFDAPEAAKAASPVPADEAIDWSRFLPTGPLPKPVANARRATQDGDVFASWSTYTGTASVRTKRGDTVLAGGHGWDSTNWRLIRHADGTWAPGYDKNGPIAEKAAPAERQLAPGWVRLETPGMNGDRMWFCICPGTARATYAKTDTLAGACGVCASRAGVFADRPASPAPANKPTFVEARAAITKPCPACNGQPFETRRCPRCHMPPKSEPVRVKIRAVGAYNDRGPVDRKWGSMVPDSPKRWLATQTGIATGLHLEKPRQPTARVGTVPQSLGAGIGIWAARGMWR